MKETVVTSVAEFQTCLQELESDEEGFCTAAREDLKRARTLVQEQGHSVLLQPIEKEFDELNRDSANSQPIQIVPHRSGYVPGVDSEKLKDFLDEADAEGFTRKDAT